MDRDLTRQQAADAESLSGSSPQRARALALSVLSETDATSDPLTVVIAERALGLAARELNDLKSARRHLRRSIELADRAGLHKEAALTKGRLAYVISLGGDTRAALAGLDRAIADVTGVARAQLQAQRALVLQRTGRVSDALDDYRLSIPRLQRAALHLDEARARSNRAVLQSYRGNYAAAEADLKRAEELAPLSGEGVSAAKIHHNLGFVAACRGNIPEALARFDRAQAEFAELGQSEAPVLADRCEVLLAVGVTREGLDVALLAVSELERDGTPLDLAEARLMAARAALRAGEFATARDSARKARAEFRRQRRGAWEALADYVITRSELDEEGPEPKDLGAVAERLAAAGWHLPALELRLAWARAALERGQSEVARRQLAMVSHHRRQRSALIRGHGWHAEALIRRSDGDARSARRALRAGLRVFDEYQASLGATDLQAHAAGHAAELAALGCQIAINEANPVVVFEWAERWRAGALRSRPVRPSGGREVEQLLEELRHATRELESATLDGRSTTKAQRDQARLEASIRNTTRHTRGSEHHRLGAPAPIAQLRRELGSRTLIEYLAFDGRLHAVTVTSRRTRLFDLGAAAEVLGELDSLRFSYARLARGSGSASTIDTFAAAAEHSARRIDERLFGPLHDEIGADSLVLVPTGRLHHLPWGALPSCMDRTISVAPSAAMWQRTHRDRRPATSERVVLVAGPGLPHAEEEIAGLAAIYPAAEVLVGDEARTARVAEALDGARLAHIAAHGSFRGDNPLFSSLQLSDGRLTVYDLELIGQAPEVVVLSACDSGLNAVHPGDELLGLSSAVLSLGSANLIATVVPVSDHVTASFMVRVHRNLATSESPAAALARAREEIGTLRHAERVTTSSFVCFGA